MAHTKAGGSSRNGRDSNAKRLGIKVHDGNQITNGSIIAKQKGNKYYPGKNTKQAKDNSIYAIKDGTVKFTSKQKTNFQGKTRKITLVNVI